MSPEARTRLDRARVTERLGYRHPIALLCSAEVAAAGRYRAQGLWAARVEALALRTGYASAWTDAPSSAASASRTGMNFPTKIGVSRSV